jgi:hypothetical protein
MRVGLESCDEPVTTEGDHSRGGEPGAAVLSHGLPDQPRPPIPARAATANSTSERMIVIPDTPPHRVPQPGCPAVQVRQMVPMVRAA